MAVSRPKAFRACWLIAFSAFWNVVSAFAVSASSNPPVPAAAAAVSCLQSQHPPERSPAQVLEGLSEACKKYGVDSFDVYGDFDQTADESFIRKMEAEIADEFGMDDAVFMPSGVMAQSIALLIHAAASSETDEKNNVSRPKMFACHHSSHLLLHEAEGYRELLHLEPIVVSTKAQANSVGLEIPAMTFDSVKEMLEPRLTDSKVTTLMLELPHREVGGKLTPWEDVLLMRDYCEQHNIRFHCDGARIFEASAGYDKSLKDLALPFDSIYISFYKGLGGISGAMLLGSDEFCKEARVWLRRFGGNLYTLLPYALSGWSGYQRYWRLAEGNVLSFPQKKDKLVGLVKRLSADDAIQKVVRFDPAVPETNMVHGYLCISAEECQQALDAVEEQCDIRVLRRVRDLSQEDVAYQAGFRSRFEWAIGEGNESIKDETFITGWSELAREIVASLQAATEE